MSPDEIHQASQKYAPALERVLELLGAPDNSRLPFAAALQQAVKELGLEYPSPEVEYGFLRLVFAVIQGQRLPGAPDA